jgi:patatin-like phospholipase/acyl hydrolase
VKVLSIDGGGIRGIIPAMVLAEIEARTGRRVADLFDLIAGTSTGGILTCALARPGALTAERLVGLYLERGPEIFRRSLLKRVFAVEGWVDERYEDDGLETALREYLEDVRLKDVTVPVFVTAYDIQDRFAFFFRSQRAQADPTYDFSLVDVARATAAAPTYFEPHEVTDAAGARTYPLIDGGIFATNPAMCAYVDHPGDVELLVSLGTGSHTRPYEFHKARWWGQLGWARPVVDMVFDGVADTIDFQLGRLLPDGGYVRLQTELTTAKDAMDDASEENLARLQEEARALIERRGADIDALCARLTA